MTYLWAFIIGGAICLIGQILLDYTKMTPARILVLFVCAGVFLTALGWYEPLVKFAGAGATIPISGFGYALATGAKKGVLENGILGIFSGGITAAAGGIAAAIVFGYIFALIFKPKEK
ncbi:MAG: stage V sporulation protein AE [Clostridia bacterium]|nr:stage V sporulation protein AE [Clostridia bacterium]